VRNIVTANIGRIVKLLARFLLLAHQVACIWWLIGAWSDEDALMDDATGPVRKTTYWPIRPNARSIRLTWNSTVSQQYFSSFYWALSTLMKTAWIPPGTTGEKVFASCIVFVGAIIFAFIVGNVTAVVKAFDAANAKRRDKIAAMRRFAETRKLTAKLTNNLLANVDAEWTWTDGISTMSFLTNTADLPKNMRTDLLRCFYKEIVDGAPLFKGLCADCVKLLLEELSPQAVVKKATLITGGRLCLDVYLLMKGALQLTMMPEESRARASSRETSSDGEASPELSTASRATSTMTRSKTMGGKKMGANFRMIERAGACIGFFTPYDLPWTAPFTVTAAKLSFLFSIRGSAMKDILSHFDLPDQDINDKATMLTNLEREFAQCAGKDGMENQKARLADKAAKAPKPAEKAPDIYAQMAKVPLVAVDTAEHIAKATTLAKMVMDGTFHSTKQIKALPLVTQAIAHLIDSSKPKPTDEDLQRAHDDVVSASEQVEGTGDMANYSPRTAMKNAGISIPVKATGKKDTAYGNSKKAMLSRGDEEDDPNRKSSAMAKEAVEGSTIAGMVM